MSNFEKENMPKHIALILDGNRRWAKQRNMPAKLGHKEGANTLETIVRYANKIGVGAITAYAFSTENWKRSEDEVSALMLLLKTYLDDFSKRADTENIKIKFIGDKTALSKSLQKSMKNAVKRTQNNTGLVFNVAINYGGRAEILRAVKNIANEVEKGKISPEEITEEMISNNLYTAGQPDPDLLIRTSGEIRLSNFLPWQLVYSEFLFVDKNWPDFTTEDLDKAIKIYQKRNRKFGGSNNTK